MTTYATLVSDIKKFMEDDGSEFADSIDTFIDITELKLSRELIVPAFRQRATSALSGNDPFITLPTDLVTLENLHLNESNVRSILLLRSDEFMIEFWPNRTATGSPRYYSYYDNTTLYVAPTPATNINVEISYRRRLPGLSGSNTTNWLSENAFDCLLYGCLVEASSFNRNDAMMQKYTALYQAAVQAVNREGNMRLSIDNFYQKSEG
tara:strand:+ start:1662 stop:2285 length:624 start_codon:yes stop_codon:yes gene_type:complete